MQTCIDIVRAYYNAIDRWEVEKAGQYLADNFHQFGPNSETMGKFETLDVLRLLIAAMPDLKHALSNVYEEGPVVSLTVQAGGRHINPLDLSLLGIGVKGIVPSSGRTIIFLPLNLEYTIVSGKIASEKNVTPPTLYNGVNGFLQAFGYSK